MLASVPPEVNTTSRAARADQRRDLLARVLDQAPRRAALGVDRRRIAGHVQRAIIGGPRLAAAAARSRSSRDRPASAIDPHPAADVSSQAPDACSFYLLLAPGSC